MPNELESGFAFSPADLQTASDFATSSTTYDNLGHATDDGYISNYWAGGKQAHQDWMTMYNAQLDRIFNANDAQKNRAFQQMMRDTQYSSLIKQLQDAGINPLYMFMGSGGAGSAPSGSSASSNVSSGRTAKESQALSAFIAAFAKIIATAMAA